MLNKLLTSLVLLTLVGCSDSSDSPVTVQRPNESGVYPPVFVEAPTDRLILWVAAEKRECMAVGPTECLQIRHHPEEDWQLFYGDIVGFDYQPGQLYQIEVSEVMIPDPPADAPDRQWILRQIISTDSE
ncbi:DUF4377 domain-containing protein [Rheinheimera sp. MM224]|uniref:DUF4377 domain-containing protein n=1 Tax=Rheinheimera sp. MM224 TaxID=3019969 RepID=UPI0021F8D3BD|nr:DUF4377 domain-containing protein [Rheinheimera sp. MM224]CAI3805982.1 hypothetical protein JAMGFMIE_04028 [Rheinheimera sp. MM224]